MLELYGPVISVFKPIFIGAGGLWLDSRAGLFESSVAIGSPPLRRFFEAALPWRYVAEMDPATRDALRRIITSIMKNSFPLFDARVVLLLLSVALIHISIEWAVCHCIMHSSGFQS